MDESALAFPPLVSSAFLVPAEASMIEQSYVKRCANANCQKENEKTWRKANGLLYCNACACYLKEHRRQRPLHLIQRTIRHSPPAQGEMTQAQLMTASSLDSSLLHSGPSASSPQLDRYASSSGLSEQQHLFFHKPLPAVRTHRSRSTDEDELYRPSSALHTTAAAVRQRSRRARNHSLVDSNFVGGVPDSPHAAADLSPSSSGDAESDATSAAAVLCMMKTGQDIYLQQACSSDADDYKPPPAKAPRRRRAETCAADVYAEEREVKQCANCGTTESGGGAWRRYKGARMCNACGVYPKQKEHLGEMRPVSCIEKAAKKARQMVKVRAEAALVAAGAYAPVVLPHADTPHAGDAIEAFYNNGLPGASVQVVMQASPSLQAPMCTDYEQVTDVACALQAQPGLEALTPLNRALFTKKQ